MIDPEVDYRGAKNSSSEDKDNRVETTATATAMAEIHVS